MLQRQLNRRGLLTGATASATLGALAGRASAETGHALEVNEVSKIELADECESAQRALTTAADVSWIASAADYGPSFQRHKCLRGVQCLLFGIGQAGHLWLKDLAGTTWFSGLILGAEDLAVSGGAPSGTWAAPAGTTVPDDVAIAAERYIASAPLPHAGYAAIAVPAERSPTDIAVAISLLRSLKARWGSRGLVVVTIAQINDTEGDAELIEELRNQGAFVIVGNLAQGTHLHNFPLSAVLTPPTSRLIGIDFADIRLLWQPGTVARLHTLPFNLHYLKYQDFQLQELASSKDDVCGLMVICYWNPASSSVLKAIDEYATCCRQLLLTADENVIVMDSARVDGETGKVDLLLIS